MQKKNKYKLTLKTFQLPIGLSNNLSCLARVTRRSERFHITKALAIYLEDYAVTQIIKKRSKDPKSKFVSGKELWKKLGLYRA